MPYVRHVTVDVASLADLVAEAGRVKSAIDDEVDRLRSEGASWLDIAEALGVSRQAAHAAHGRRTT